MSRTPDSTALHGRIDRIHGAVWHDVPACTRILDALNAKLRELENELAPAIARPKVSA